MKKKEEFTFSICGDRKRTLKIITHLLGWFNLKVQEIKTDIQIWGPNISAVLKGEIKGEDNE